MTERTYAYVAPDLDGPGIASAVELESLQIVLRCRSTPDKPIDRPLPLSNRLSRKSGECKRTDLIVRYYSQRFASPQDH